MDMILNNPSNAIQTSLSLPPSLLLQQMFDILSYEPGSTPFVRRMGKVSLYIVYHGESLVGNNVSTLVCSLLLLNMEKHFH